MREPVLKKIVISLLLAHVVLAIWIVHDGWQGVYLEREIPQHARSFTIAQGASLNSVLAHLKELGLGPAPIFVRLALAHEGEQVVVKKGTYSLEGRASTRELLQLFQDGRVRLFKVTVPEGLDRWQVAEVLAETRWGNLSDFHVLIESPQLIQHLDPDATSLEGYLFPETYFFDESASPQEVIEGMVKQFERHTEPLRPALLKHKLTLREWVSFASLVEKESAVVEERPIVASVILNRLNRGMLLQCDPTIIYSLKLVNRYRGKIYRSDIRHDHAYNTYVHRGLPPGPIANPSLSSLHAVLNHKETAYLYFVAKKDGTHHFSKSLNEHNRAVRMYLRN